MIKVYTKFNDMPEYTCFTFKKLFGLDVVNSKGFAVCTNAWKLYDFTKIIGHSGCIEYDMERFTWQSAPEFYCIIEAQ